MVILLKDAYKFWRLGIEPDTTLTTTTLSFPPPPPPHHHRYTDLRAIIFSVWLCCGPCLWLLKGPELAEREAEICCRWPSSHELSRVMAILSHLVVYLINRLPIRNGLLFLVVYSPTESLAKNEIFMAVYYRAFP